NSKFKVVIGDGNDINDLKEVIKEKKNHASMFLLLTRLHYGDIDGIVYDSISGFLHNDGEDKGED
ncbi:13989_t:CDS:1, partial [Funneliformis geosporum]